MEAEPLKTVKLLFRKGDPAGAGQPASTAYTRINGGWFGPDGIPDMEIDLDVISPNEADVFAEALARNSFFGPSSWYVNHENNAAFSAKVNSVAITKPVLFFHGEYDYVCQTATGTLADPMRARCSDLTEIYVKSGHWMAQERPIEVNSGLTHWLINNVGYWPEVARS
jgi:pimeloyl-ACP methyl ester carboxylesterase